jgi:hypothetical protein
MTRLCRRLRVWRRGLEKEHLPVAVAFLHYWLGKKSGGQAGVPVLLVQHPA